MKQKTLLLLIVLLIIALVGLGVYVYQQRSVQIQTMQKNQQSSQKQIGDLNDRLVAVARQLQDTTPATMASSHVAMRLSQSQQTQVNDQQHELRQLQRQWSLTALQLAQDYLRQANYEKAQNLLLQLQQNMIESQSTIADPFNHTLLQTLKIDQLNISQEAQRQRQTRSSLDQNLAQLQQQLNLMSIQPPRSLLDASSTTNKNTNAVTAWFKQLFLLQPADANTTQHMLDRSFICKQASLNIAMARLALISNNQVGFSSSVSEAAVQLNLLADANAQQIALQLNKLKSTTLPATVQLTSLTLLSGQKSTP